MGGHNSKWLWLTRDLDLNVGLGNVCSFRALQRLHQLHRGADINMSVSHGERNANAMRVDDPTLGTELQARVEANGAGKTEEVDGFPRNDF
jgi:hypothetical protein